MCIQRSIPPPTIVTESGRALASHHSVLVFDVLTTCAAGAGQAARPAGGRAPVRSQPMPHALAPAPCPLPQPRVPAREACGAGGGGGLDRDPGRQGGPCVCVCACVCTCFCWGLHEHLHRPAATPTCILRLAPPPHPPWPPQPLTKQLRAAARSGKGAFLLMTFKDVYNNIAPGEAKGSTCLPAFCRLPAVPGDVSAAGLEARSAARRSTPSPVPPAAALLQSHCPPSLPARFSPTHPPVQTRARCVRRTTTRATARTRACAPSS